MFDPRNAESEYIGQTFSGLSLAGETLGSIEFDDCVFKECDFSEVVFERCNFIDCQFEACNLSVVKLAYSRFSEVKFVDCKLVGVNWTELSLPNFSSGSPIHFEQCVLNDSSFFGMALSEITMERCKLYDVDFREADLSEGRFSHSDFTLALFHHTNLRDADLTEAENYDIDVLNNELKGARFTRFEAVRLLEGLGLELVD